MTEQQIDRERRAMWRQIATDAGDDPYVNTLHPDEVLALLAQLDEAEAIILRQERYIEGLEAVDAVGLKARADQAEARIKAVEDVLSKHESILGDNLGVPVERIRRALEGGEDRDTSRGESHVGQA